MTVLSDISSLLYNGNSNDPQTFNVTYYFVDSAHLVVNKVSNGIDTLLVETTDYVVTGTGDKDGGYITMTYDADLGLDSRILPTDQIRIDRTLPVQQAIDYITGGKFRAETHEEGLDRIVMILQQVLRGGINFTSFPHSSLSQNDMLTAGHTYIAPFASAIAHNPGTRLQEETSFLDFVPLGQRQGILDGTGSECMADPFINMFQEVGLVGGVVNLPAGKTLYLRDKGVVPVIDTIKNLTIRGNGCTIKIASDCPRQLPDYAWFGFYANTLLNVLFEDIIWDFNCRGNGAKTLPPSTPYPGGMGGVASAIHYRDSENLRFLRCHFVDWSMPMAVQSGPVGTDQHVKYVVFDSCHFNGGPDGLGAHHRNSDISSVVYSGASGNTVDTMLVEAPGISFWMNITYRVEIETGGTTFKVTRVSAAAYNGTPYAEPASEVELASGVSIATYTGTWFDFTAANLTTTGVDEGEWGMTNNPIGGGHFSGRPRIQFDADATHTYGDTWVFAWTDLRPAPPRLGGSADNKAGNVGCGFVNCKSYGGVRGHYFLSQATAPFLIGNQSWDTLNSFVHFYDCDDPICMNNYGDTCQEWGGEWSGNNGGICTGNIFKNTALGGIMFFGSGRSLTPMIIKDNIFINPRTMSSYRTASKVADGPGGILINNIDDGADHIISNNIIINDNVTYPYMSHGICESGDPSFTNLIISDNIVTGAEEEPIDPQLVARASVYRHNGNSWNNKLITFEAEYDNTTNDAIDFNNGQKQKLTPSGATTYTFTNPTDGPCDLRLKLVDGASNNPTWPAEVLWQGGVEPLWTAGTDFINFYWDGTNYYGSAGFNFQ